ncbi:hypothetical protein [Vibrio sp. NTOU-M3]|uniref:hypothetical protein n=1 Tax=unclassified Vibrio TaxID=2614977 RepID=UPI00349F414C
MSLFNRSLIALFILVFAKPTLAVTLMWVGQVPLAIDDHKLTTEFIKIVYKKDSQLHSEANYPFYVTKINERVALVCNDT